LSAMGNARREGKANFGRGARTVIALVTLLLLGLAATGYVTLYVLDLNSYKGTISDAVQRATGRQLSIAGDIGLSRALPPVLSVGDVSFANAPWGTPSPMARVTELQVQVALLPLLKRQLVFERLDLAGATLLLETAVTGDGNWELATASDPGEGIRSLSDVQLTNLRIKDLSVSFRNGKSGSKTQFQLASLVVESRPSEKYASVELSGAWQGQPVTLLGRVGLLMTTQAAKPFPIDLSGEVGGAKIRLTGAIEDLFNLTAIDLQLEASGTNLAHLGAAGGVELPKTNSYELTARLEGSRRALQVTALHATTRSGSVSVEVSGTVGDLRALGNVALQLQVSGSDLSLLGPILDEAVAETGPFSATGRLQGSPGAFAFRDARMDIALGESAIHLEGIVDDLSSGRGVNMSLEATGPNLAELGEVIRRHLPDTGAFKISGQLEGAFNRLALANAEGKLDWRDVSLTATGAVADLDMLSGIDLRVTATGTSLDRAGRLIGQNWPRTGPFELSGRLTGHSNALGLRDGKMRVGHSGLTLAATGSVGNVIALSGVNLRFDAAGKDLAEIASFVNHPLPHAGPFEVRGHIKGSRKRLALVDARGTLIHGGAKLSAEGAVSDLQALEGLDFQVTASGEELAELNPLIGRELPNLGRFKLTGHLTGSAVQLTLRDASAVVGRSDFDGTISVALGDRPKFHVRLNFGVLDYTPFMVVAEREEERKSEHGARSRRLFSDAPLGLDALQALDADFAVTARRIRVSDAELEFGQLALSLLNGVLSVDNLEANYKGTRITGWAHVESGSPPRMQLDFLVQGFDLGSFLAQIQATGEVQGHLDIALDVSGQGDSIRALMANLDGNVGIVMGKGRASRYLDLLADDLSRRVMRFWGHHKEAARIECGVVQFDIEHGIAISRVFVFETKRGIIEAEGNINLASEDIDFLLKPRPRNPSLVSLATDLRVTGRLTSPHVSPDVFAMAKKGAKLLGVLAVGRLGILAPFVRLGARNKHPCDIRALDEHLQEAPAVGEDAPERNRM
jgi:uncharacterized protein involved in outer membrane biogenesis